MWHVECSMKALMMPSDAASILLLHSLSYTALPVCLDRGTILYHQCRNTGSLCTPAQTAGFAKNRLLQTYEVWSYINAGPLQRGDLSELHA